MRLNHALCPTQAAWGKCGESWMQNSCQQSCNRCMCPGGSNSTQATPQTPMAPAPSPQAPPPLASPSPPAQQPNPSYPLPAPAPANASQQQLLQPLFNQLQQGGAPPAPTSAPAPPLACQTDVLDFLRWASLKYLQLLVHSDTM